MKRPHRKHEQRIHVSKQKFYCEECGRTADYRKSLKKHLRGHEQLIRSPLHCNKKNDKTSDDDDAERKPQEQDETEEETDDAVRAHCVTLEDYDPTDDEYGYEPDGGHSDGYEDC